MQSFSVAIQDDSIKLGQFLKLASLVGTGGEAKEAIATGQVSVNGEVATQRGITLTPGDEVSLGGQVARVEQSGDDDYFDEATADDDFDPEKWRNL